MIRHWSRRFGRGSTARNVAVLMIGTVAGQAIPVLISPLISRMYTPADFGVYSLFTSLGLLIGVVSAGRYEMAIMLPRRDDEALSLVRLCVRLLPLVSIGFAVPLVLFHRPIAALVKNEAAAGWLGWTAAAGFSIGLFQTVTLWLNRKNRYRDMTLSKIMQAGIAAACMLGIGALAAGPAGLVLGFLFSQMLPALWFGREVLRRTLAGDSGAPGCGLREVAVRYRDFPAVNALHAFTDQLQASGIVFLISALFNITVCGYYGFTMRVLRTPLLFIGRAVSQVFYQKAAETFNAGRDLHGMVKRAMIRLALVGAPIFGLIYLTAPFVFGVVFGEKWRPAGEYARILAPWLFFNFISSSLSQLPLLVNEQRKNLVIGLAYNGLMMGFIWVGYRTGDIRNGFVLMSAVLSVYVAATLAWYLHISKKPASQARPADAFVQPAE
jgi:O-antigen/teichoic acid export membrane protein